MAEVHTALLGDTIGWLKLAAQQEKRNLQMPGIPRYQPADLRPYLGYDQEAGWRIIVSWFWLLALAKHGEIPEKEARLLKPALLKKLLVSITETEVAALEPRMGGHDIMALLALMREYLPKSLHRWLHETLTSYDVICTAYALQAKHTFLDVFEPKMKEVDELWRGHIATTQDVLQIGRTHLQDALPLTVGCWLSILHNRFVANAHEARRRVHEIPGKSSGAVGTSAALRALGIQGDPEAMLLEMLGLPPAKPSTQITQPEGLEGFYHAIMLISAVLANLGDDVRHLQASAIAEVISASSTSSSMSHKGANPVAAEQMDGMHISVRCEYYKVVEVLNSTLQRTLVNSSVMRSFPVILVLTYQQFLSTQRVFNSLRVNEAQCWKNFQHAGKLVVAELLHLSLQTAGYPHAQEFVNQRVVPSALASGTNLREEMNAIVKQSTDKQLERIWRKLPKRVLRFLEHPDAYLGDAVEIARAETNNAL